MSSIDCEDLELLEGFLAEPTELLEKLDDDLVALEKAPDDSELLNRIFRTIHTIKGSSSFLGFDLLVKVTHKTEGALNRLQRGIRQAGQAHEFRDVRVANAGSENAHVAGGEGFHPPAIFCFPRDPMAKAHQNI